MKAYRKTIQIGIFSLILVTGILTIFNQILNSDDPKTLKIGDRPPSFSLLDLEDQMHSLSQYEGKLTVINFWGTFCPPCRNEMPALQNQFDKWHDQGVTFLGISVDKSKVTVQSFINQYQIHFPILLDFQEKTRAEYHVLYYPTTFFVLPNGRIAEIRIGEMTESYIDETIQSLLSI